MGSFRLRWWDSPLRSKEATAIKAVPERIEAATQEPARGTDPFGSDGWQG